MAMISAHLVDQVFPLVATRQFVLSLPKWLRYYVAKDSSLSGKVLKIFMQAIEKQFKKNVIHIPTTAKLGAVTFIQRFGSSLNHHLHYHSIVIEGLFYDDEAGRIKYAAIEHLGPEDSKSIEQDVRKRVLKLFKRKGLLTLEQVEDIMSWRHSGGFSVNADVGIDAEDRAGLERLLRYCARPAFANEQLTLESDDMIHYRLSKPTHKGETELRLRPFEFFDKVAKLIPPPRKHRHHYHGVLSPNSPLRKSIVAHAGKLLPGAIVHLKKKSAHSALTEEVSLKIRYLWCILLARVYEIMPLQCPCCGGQMKIIAFIKDQHSISKILTQFDEPIEAPQYMTARGPPEPGFEQDNNDTDEVFEPIPSDDFDQRISW